MTFWKQLYSWKQLYGQGGFICLLWGQVKRSFCTACTLVHSTGPTCSNPIISLDEETFSQNREKFADSWVRSFILICHIPIYLWHSFYVQQKYLSVAGCEATTPLFTCLSLCATTSMEHRACSSSHPLFPDHCKEFARLFVRESASLLCILRHPGNSISWSWKVQKLSIRVYLPVSLLCLRLMLLEKTKDFVMKQKISMPNAQFNQYVLFFQFFVNF